MDPENEEVTTTDTAPAEAPAAVEAPAPAADIGDDFDAAFAEATGGTPAAKPAEAPLEKPAAAAEAPAAEDDPNKTVAPEVAAAEKIESAAEPKPAPVAAPAADQVPANLDPKYLAQAIAEEQEARARAAAANKPAEPAQQKDYTAADFIAPETQAKIDKFKQEWPEEFPAIEAMVEARAQALFVNGQNALIAQLNPIILDLQNKYAAAQTITHTSEIGKAHPDYETIGPKVAEWVKTQPAFLQPAYQNVLQEGDTKSIIELLNTFKASTGQTGAAPQTASSAVQEAKPAPAKKPVPPAAAAALAAVPAARRAQPTNAADPSDFNAAFEEATAALANS